MSWKHSPSLQVLDRPEPGPGQVVVQVGGAGACHSDLHLMRDAEPGVLPWNPPFTLGHENAGWVHAVGDGVHDLEPGAPVAVVGAWGCGRCARCRAGWENYCESPVDAPVPAGGGGLGLDGGMAEYLLVPAARHLVPLPPGLEPATAAPLTDAGLTPYHAVRRSLPKLVPDAAALVIGAGGLGHLAVQLLKALCAARVVVVEPREEARRVSLDAGADGAIAPGPDAAGRVRDATDGRGADVVLDFVGTDETLALAAGTVRTLGDLTIVGIGGGALPMAFGAVPHEVSVQTTYWGSRAELVEVLGLAARGLVSARSELFPLEEAATAYERLEAGDVDGRAVITPFASYTP